MEEQARYEKYWQVQIATVQFLSTIGFKFHVKDRLPLFKLYSSVSSRVTGPKADMALNFVEALVSLRRLGYEPPSKRGRYV